MREGQDSGKRRPHGRKKTPQTPGAPRCDRWQQSATAPPRISGAAPVLSGAAHAVGAGLTRRLRRDSQAVALGPRTGDNTRADLSASDAGLTVA
jgi:hypothetical protein